MSFLVPTNPLLLGLSKEQLLRKRVCEKHFDKQQFDAEGKRLRFSYPCLFRDDEIAHGEPLAALGTVPHALSDHNYFKDQDDEDNTIEQTLVIGRPGEDFHEHPSCSYSQVEPSILQNKDVIAVEENSSSLPKVIEKAVQEVSSAHTDVIAVNEGSSSLPKVIEEAVLKLSLVQADVVAVDGGSSSLPKLVEEAVLEVSSAHTKIKPTPSRSAQEKELTRKPRGTIMKQLSSKGRKFVKNVMNIASTSLGQTSEQRLSQAKSYGSNEQLFKNFDLLNKQAQTVLLMQLKQCRNNKMARRFTMKEKLMALMLMKQSPKAYKLLETMFALPNKRTLHRLSEKICMKPGVNPQIFSHIRNTVNHWGQQQKLCSIVFDEIALTPYLTYNESNDLIHGFVDVAGERKLKFCDNALVFMVRGICSSWRQCISYYFCEGTTSTAEMQEILKQTVAEVAQTGLIPLGLVCDQGSTFRTAIKKFREETIRNCNLEANTKDDGTINIAGHNLSIFFDPPHLLKGLRNNFLNKNIIWEGKRASWKDIQFIYDIDNRLGHTRALPKLTAHHVDPDKIKKMKVSVAAQVFSSRTAAMLNYTAALNNLHNGSDSSDTMEATAEIIEFFDTLFDSVNGSPGATTKGKLRKAVKKNSAHHRFWLEAIEKLKKIHYQDTNSKLAERQGNPRMVRVPSLEGWIVTLESFSRISKILFDEFGVEYYYPRYINQDPLENFFGRVRALNYRNVKPNANSFIYTFKSLLLSNLLSPHSKFANCEVDSGETILDASFLFELDDENKENTSPNISSLPSTSQDLPSGSKLEGMKTKKTCGTRGTAAVKLLHSILYQLMQL
ncbi:uncharacterized protein LOC133517862 [Cydia pomonella]|uniref:uncharacterized protein LOC133517862 n=1 Tax=Cydia pomonella TaxID=82600 RepID=UPI002ADDDF28|nr:uncharacterized protein LOC133517862 [Cydia pomonella]